MDTETDILARTLYGEARGEDLKGIEAVAAVILNRVRYAAAGGPRWWGRTVREVCLKPAQFSCWNAADPNRAKLTGDLADDPAFAICRRVAVRAIKGILPDPTHGATHYHALSVNPRWASALIPTAQIGNHLFYTCL